MYERFFGFEEPPFSIAPDPRYLYMSAKHREALAHLLYGIRSEGGFVLLTGEVGAGKTTVCRCLLEQLPEGTEVAFIINPKVTAAELLASICDELGIAPQRTDSVKELVDVINRHLLATDRRGGRVLLIIDEAQNLSPDVLEQIRLLTNLETSRRKLLQVILIGQPELNLILERPELRQLSQRITARYHLTPLSLDETRAYILHRLKVAGMSGSPFPAAIIAAVHRRSRGIPRLINVICDRCLLGAYAEGKKKVSRAIFRKAAGEVMGKNAAMRPATALLAAALTAALILFLAASPLSPLSTTGAKKRTDTRQTTALPEKAPARTPGHDPAAELCRLWRVPAPHTGADVCASARAAGLACLESRGSFGTLASLGRPALIRLRSHDGATNRFLVTGMDSQGVIVLGSEETRIPFARAVREWDGRFTMFWQPPPGYKKPFTSGDAGPATAWLRRTLAMGAPGEPFDKRLENAVRKIQKEHGLEADGIVGPETVIVINRFIARKGPFLKTR